MAVTLPPPRSLIPSSLIFLRAGGYQLLKCGGETLHAWIRRAHAAQTFFHAVLCSVTLRISEADVDGWPCPHDHSNHLVVSKHRCRPEVGGVKTRRQVQIRALLDELFGDAMVVEGYRH